MVKIKSIFPTDKNEIDLVKFINTYQYLSPKDLPYFFNTTYYPKRIAKLIQNNILRRYKRFLVLGEDGSNFMKILGLETNKLRYQEKYANRLKFMSHLAAYFRYSNVTFTPSFLIKDKTAFTESSRKYIGVSNIFGTKYLTYHISNEHTDKYLNSVIYDLQKELKYKNVIIMIDNCYGEFVQDREPIEVGADIAVGSLMKNLGAGIATSGAYIVGKRELIELCAERLTSPGIGKEIGPSLNQNTLLLKGLFFAPSVVASSIKTAVFASRILEELGYQVEPKFDEERADIVQTIALGTEEKLVKFCQGIQMGSPIDSKVIPYPGDMGGYEDKVIMAAGTFTQGSTIELSCDGPIRPPYIAYMQGGLTYEYGKMGILKAIEYMEK